MRDRAVFAHVRDVIRVLVPDPARLDPAVHLVADHLHGRRRASTRTAFDTTTISAEPSLSMSATIGYSVNVPLVRGICSSAWPVIAEHVHELLVGVHRLGVAVAEEVERGAGRDARLVADRRASSGSSRRRCTSCSCSPSSSRIRDAVAVEVVDGRRAQPRVEADRIAGRATFAEYFTVPSSSITARPSFVREQRPRARDPRRGSRPADSRAGGSSSSMSVPSW